MFIINVLVSFVAATSCLPFGTLDVHSQSQHSVQNYSTTFLDCQYNNKKVFALRQMSLNSKNTALVVDANTLETRLIDSSCLSCSSMTSSSYMQSSYGNLLDAAMSAPYPLQNDGITSGNSSQKMVAATIDMCPSQKGISQNVYDRLITLATTTGTSIPVGIAMTKKWLEKYPTHFNWLKQQHIQQKLKILWINHSANHYYNKNLSLSQNFLLAPNTDFENEVFSTEIALIRSGTTPSVFFRFPGLVSSQDLIEKLGDWGLAALGSNAWLAKGENAQNRNSIILIHGNRNEPTGETLFLNYVEQKSSDIAWASLLDILNY